MGEGGEQPGNQINHFHFTFVIVVIIIIIILYYCYCYNFEDGEQPGKQEQSSLDCFNLL